jgi:hypothetical protein
MDELLPLMVAACMILLVALNYFADRGMLLLYGDAVAHLHIARRVFDTRHPGLGQLGGVWLPLPHVLLLPFVQRLEWWRTGLAGAWPSMICCVAAVAGLYRLARHWMSMRWAMAVVALFALNPAMIYLSTTAMTEPLFLALMIWTALEMWELKLALGAGSARGAKRCMAALALLIAGAVYTRYDGWILGAAAWCMALVWVWKARERVKLWGAFAVFTVVVAAAPAGWLAYNAHYCGDALDFMRGPYSAAAIERRTTPAGAPHYRGWHNPGWALLFYTRTAQVDAAARESGFALMALALWGLAVAWARRCEARGVLTLLWLPLPFYVYSIAWGSVPIFIPQLYPHSYYNSRYGMEMLPALYVSACAAVVWAEHKWWGGNARVKAAVWLVVIAAAVANCAVLFHDEPLVLQEAYRNSSTRIPMERQMAQQLEAMPPGATVLMWVSDHPGAVMQAGLRLRDIVNESDADSFGAALADPAAHAEYVLAVKGDAVARAVEAHPAGLELESVLDSTGQPEVRVYRSLAYAGGRR